MNDRTHRHHSRVAVVLILVLVLTGCGSRQASFDLEIGAGGDQVLTLAGGGALPITLDPALLRDADSSFLARQIFRGLMRLDDSLIAQPDLAETVDASDDGLNYTFTLRENLTFQDGTAIDAERVKASFERAADPELAGGDGSELPAAIYFGDIEGIDEYLAGQAGTITGIQTSGTQTVRMTLKRPAANFLYKLTGSPAAIVDVRETTGSDWWTEANGSGPFQIDDVSSQLIRLIPFDGFYAGAPRLQQVNILYGSAAAQPLNLYETGVIDTTEVPFYAIDRVSSPADPLYAELETTPQLSTTFILLNENVEPFDDPAVRQAVVQALDRSKVTRVSLEDRVRQAEGIVPPGILDRDWASTPPAYDLGAAQAALASAQPFQIAPAFYGGGVAVTLAQVLERDLGLDSDAISLEWSEFSSALTTRQLSAFALSWIADYPDPANFLDSMFHTGSPDNYADYSNPEVDALLDNAAVEQDPVRRARRYLDAQQLILDDYVLIPLYHDIAYTLVKPYVRGLTITPVGIMSLESVWIGER
ncbi:MAG: peptide ABC transporter substrate-binding protein [Thermomicrobiales bacterium]|nr:peptide ABC transporter substrate-binding protein [Thermomicrobiales bacterium]